MYEGQATQGISSMQQMGYAQSASTREPTREETHAEAIMNLRAHCSDIEVKLAKAVQIANDRLDQIERILTQQVGAQLVELRPEYQTSSSPGRF